MAHRKQEEVLVLNLEHMTCLASPPRMEILRALRTLNAGSVTEVAEMTGRTATSLYYHLNQLMECRLVEIDHTRRAGKRDEAVYRVVADTFQFDRTRKDKQYREAQAKYTSASLRMLDRRYQLSAKTCRSDHALFYETLNVVLDDQELQKLKDNLLEALLDAKDSASEGEGTRVAIGTIIVPVLKD